MISEKLDILPSPNLLRNRLENLLNHRHELYRLAALIDWSKFDSKLGPSVLSE